MSEAKGGKRFLSEPYSAYARGALPREDAALTHVEAGSAEIGRASCRERVYVLV